MKDFPGVNGEREKFFMLIKNFFKRSAVIDNDVIFSEIGLGKMPAILTTEDPDLITVAENFYLRFVYKDFLDHDIPRAASAIIKIIKH
ncbi:MAG: hypothetical protein FD174_2705 [Geobacteraceae bacterium]|nr:MAG: hypothetical protein FD174_2705 [Geobacteraceae bacterium]